MWEVMKELSLIVYRQLEIFNVFKISMVFEKVSLFWSMRAKKDFVC